MKLKQNEAKLFYFLSEYIGSVATEEKYLFTTLDKNIICAVHINNVYDLSSCDHEEANTSIILHALHCAKQGHDMDIIKTVETDVAVLAVIAFHSISMFKEPWIDFRVNKHHRYNSSHGTAKALVKEKAKAFPYFHAFTGCDIVSSVNRIKSLGNLESFTFLNKDISIISKL